MKCRNCQNLTRTPSKQRHWYEDQLCVFCANELMPDKYPIKPPPNMVRENHRKFGKQVRDAGRLRG